MNRQKKFCTHAMKKFIRSFWFTIHYHHHRITNRSQNLFGSNLLVDRLSGDQGRVLREICLSYLKRKKKKKIKKKKDSNRLEIGACLKQTKIDVKNALLLIATSFFSLSCFYFFKHHLAHLHLLTTPFGSGRSTDESLCTRFGPPIPLS